VTGSGIVSFFGVRMLNGAAVPTSDINTTFALALSVWILMISLRSRLKALAASFTNYSVRHSVQKSGVASKLPVHLIEYVSKPLSHSLRLFGNMYAGEVIFLLLGLWAATGVTGTIAGAILGAGWSIFHILIVALQAFIS